MKQLMLRHAFKFVSRVTFLIGENNQRSRRAVEKIGAVLVGSRHRDRKDCVLYQITKVGAN
jgi:RimJ/RimL family protein N-acetyltransferase